MSVLALTALFILACSGDSEPTPAAARLSVPPLPPPEEPGSQPPPLADRALILSSVAFPPGGGIPTMYTCEGDDTSLPLDWHGVPGDTQSLALIVEDPDAPDPAAPTTIWTHWLLYNMPPDDSGLPESARHLPPGTLEGKNDWGRTGYGGPCPPVGEHRYFHKLYALDTVLPDLGEPDRAALLQAMEGHVLLQVELVGTYAKRGD